MARLTGLRVGQVCTIRSGVVAIAADSATLTDANIPVSGAFDPSGLDTVFLGVEIDGGASPTMTVEFLFRDLNAPDGLRWKRILLGARDGITGLASVASETSGALDGTAFVEMRCYGYSLVFPRITAVANAGSTTGWRMLAIPGRARDTMRLNVS